MTCFLEKPSWVLFETDREVESPVLPSAGEWKWKVVWLNVFAFTLLHIGAVYGAFLFLTKATWATVIFAVCLYLCSGLGATAGAHRLWSHKSYKARLPLRLLLTFFHSMTFQGPLLNWSRDHRLHHKYSETDADPHNATQGLFFSHIGWLMVRKLPELLAKGQKIDVSDLWADPLLRFQKKYYVGLVLIGCFILPTYIPTLWKESAWNAFWVCAIFRFIFLLNVTFFVNSVAHKSGARPYDRNINPVDIKSLSSHLG